MIDTTSLFVHVLAAMGIVSGGVVQILAGVRLRAAATAHEVVTWARFARTAGLIIVGSAVVSLMTGGHLAGAVWTSDAKSGFAFPFISLGVAGLVLLAPIGPMIGGARLRRLIAAAGTDATAPVSADLLAQARSPKLWGPIHSLLGVAIGLVALMVYKPGWVAGAIVLLVGFAAGWAVGIAVSRTTDRAHATA